MNVWVTDMATIKMDNTNTDVKFNRNKEDDNTTSDTKLICMPGVRPVMLPKNIPRNTAIIISSII